MARNTPKGREEAKKGGKPSATGGRESASTAITRFPRDELVAFRATNEMMSKCAELIKDHGITKAPLAAMLKADACALSGDSNGFVFYALVSTLCVINVMLNDKDTITEHVRWKDIV
jgi:hypothetical protein